MKHFTDSFLMGGFIGLIFMTYNNYKLFQMTDEILKKDRERD